MMRLLRWVLALLLVCAGIVLAGLGGLGLSVFGTNGTFGAAGSTVNSSANSFALVADLSGVEVDIPFHELLGEVALSATSSDGRPIFLGQAAQPAVDQYLFGAPYDLAVKNGGWTTTPVPGVVTKLAPPADQTFWAAASSGSKPTIPITLPQAPQSLVVMNADATVGVAATITLSFVGERVVQYSVASIVVGTLLVLLALVVLLAGRKRRRAKRTAKPGPATRPAATAPNPDEVVDLATGQSDPMLVDQNAGDESTGPSDTQRPAG